jgi:hypothetical protein
MTTVTSGVTTLKQTQSMPAGNSHVAKHWSSSFTIGTGKFALQKTTGTAARTSAIVRTAAPDLTAWTTKREHNPEMDLGLLLQAVR